MLYLYWILLFLKNFLDYEKIDVRIQILRRHKLNPVLSRGRSFPSQNRFMSGLLHICLIVTT